MTLFLLILVGIPIFWLLGFIFYVLSWLDCDKEHAYIDK